MSSVYVSGATGFIAQHIVKDLIAKGYKVIGSVRSATKGDQLKLDVNSDNFTYEIVKDVAEPNAFDESLKKHPEIEYFMHTASPFHYNTNDVEKDLLIPAIHGTKNALNSIKKYGPQIKSVVITSSFAAVGKPDGTYTPTEPLTENSWYESTWETALSSPQLGYRASKLFAEKAAWEFMEKEKPNFTLNTVCPSFVFGPQAFTSGLNKEVLNTSSESINSYLKLKPTDPVPSGFGGYADVRDVSKAHIYAIEHDIKDFRFLIFADRWTGQIILDILNENFDQLKGKIPLGNPGTTREVLEPLAKVDASKTIGMIGEFVSLKQSVIDSVAQILDYKQ